ncbi:unnamed protein product, partial [Closterium sp. Yama58-4]
MFFPRRLWDDQDSPTTSHFPHVHALHMLFPVSSNLSRILLFSLRLPRSASLREPALTFGKFSLHSAPPLSALTRSFPYSSPLSFLNHLMPLYFSPLILPLIHPFIPRSPHPFLPSSLPFSILRSDSHGWSPRLQGPRQGRAAGGGGGLGVGVRGAGAGEGLRSSDGGGGAGGSAGSGGGGHGNGGGRPRKTSRLLLHIRGEAAGNRGAGLVRVALDRGGAGARRGRGTDVYEASREGEIVNAWDPLYGLEIDVWDPRTHNPLNKQL